jgi:hypothetical protein
MQKCADFVYYTSTLPHATQLLVHCHFNVADLHIHRIEGGIKVTIKLSTKKI